MDLSLRRPPKKFDYDRFGYSVPEFPDEDGVAPPFTIPQFPAIMDEVEKKAAALADVPDSDFAGGVWSPHGILYMVRHVQAHVARISLILSRSGRATAAWR